MIPKSINSGSLKSDSIIHTAETEIGEIDVTNYNTLVFFLKYTKGDESGVYITPKFLFEHGGDEHAYMEWSSAADAVVTARRFYMTASGNRYIMLDVRGMQKVKLYEQKNGGTPTGTLKVDYRMMTD